MTLFYLLRVMMDFLGDCEFIMLILTSILSMVGFVIGINVLRRRGFAIAALVIVLSVPITFPVIGIAAILTWIVTGFIFGLRMIFLKGYVRVVFVLAVLMPIFITYEAYSITHPSDWSGKSTFRSNFGVPFPANGVFIFKQASYPHSQGDYDKQFVFQVTQEEYDEMKQMFSGRLRNDTVILSDHFRFIDSATIDKYVPVLKSKKAKEIISFMVFILETKRVPFFIF